MVARRKRKVAAEAESAMESNHLVVLCWYTITSLHAKAFDDLFKYHLPVLKGTVKSSRIIFSISRVLTRTDNPPSDVVFAATIERLRQKVGTSLNVLERINMTVSRDYKLKVIY